MTVALARRPAVAGFFYPAEPERLAQAVDTLLVRTDGPAARLVIAPHSALERSGRVAGLTVARMADAECCVVLAPSHTGDARPATLLTSGTCATPLGEVAIESEIARQLLARCPGIADDPWAQKGEHGVEALLPFLQRRFAGGVRIVPVVLGAAQEAVLPQLSQALAAILAGQPNTALLASAELSHFQPDEDARRMDGRLLELAGRIDPDGFRRQVQEADVRTCSDGVIWCALDTARHLGWRRAECVAYATSAEAGGDPYSATGYAGMLLGDAGSGATP